FFLARRRLTPLPNTPMATAIPGAGRASVLVGFWISLARDASSRNSRCNYLRRPLPTRIRMPSCSLPSRTSPSGGHTWPSLTAAPRAGCALMQAGTKEWLRPNKRMEQEKKTKWHHTTYPEAEASTVHQTEASSSAPLAISVEKREYESSCVKNSHSGILT